MPQVERVTGRETATTGTPAPTYAFSRWLFTRALGVVYLFAFWSVAQQIRGLAGHDGILPAREYMAAAASWAESQQIGAARWYLVPTIFWISTADWFLIGVSVSGACLAALLIAGAAPALLLALLWIGYLSLSVICRDFLSYQWDALLLETGLLAILIAPLTWWDRVGRAIGSTVFTGLGYLVSGSATLLLGKVRRVQFWLLGALAVGVVLVFLIHWTAKKELHLEDGEASSAPD